MGRSFLASTLFHVVLLAVFAVGLQLSVRAPVQEAIPIEVVDAASLGPAAPTPPKPAPAATAPLPERDAAKPVPPPPTPAPPAPPEPAPPPEPPPPPKVVEAPPPPPEPKVTPPEPKLAEPLPPPKVPDKPKPVAATPPKPEPPKPEKPKEPDKPKLAEKPKEAPPKPAPQSPKPPQTKVAEKPKPDTKPAKTKADSKAEPDTLDTLLASVEKLDKRVKGEQTKDGKGDAKATASADSTKSKGPANLTAGELAGIKRQVEQCWNVPVGVEGIEEMQVKLRILMNPDGTAGKVSVEDQARMAAEPGFRTVAESARRAVLGCKLTLPAEKYDLWKDMVMTFYPKDAISG
ncbi:MAG: hypothetical protein U1E45_18750 [Geminicoccaceae bacterium]